MLDTVGPASTAVKPPDNFKPSTTQKLTLGLLCIASPISRLT
jgi:hypothetical protein